MALLNLIFFGFLGACAIVVSVRAGKLVIKAINGIFDRIESFLG